MLKLWEFSWMAAHSYCWLAWVYDAHLRRLMTNGVDELGMEISTLPYNFIVFVWHFCANAINSEYICLLIPNCFKYIGIKHPNSRMWTVGTKCYCTHVRNRWGNPSRPEADSARSSKINSQRLVSKKSNISIYHQRSWPHLNYVFKNS